MKVKTLSGKKILTVLVCVLAAAVALTIGTQGILAVQTSASKRALPIYNVKTDEKKVAISFDAACENVILVTS